MALDSGKIDISGLNLSGLPEDEQQRIISVMKKARDIEAQEEMNQMLQPTSGQLYKYTNVMKGWQYRWFVLEPDTGRFDYFEREEHKQQQQKARGSIHLAGAVISPSDEDSMTFIVNAANGEIYRLRAFDAKERQHWVNRLRATAEHHTDSIVQNLPSFSKDGRLGGVMATHQQLSRKNSGSLDSLPGNRRKSESDAKTATIPSMTSSSASEEPSTPSSPPKSPKSQSAPKPCKNNYAHKNSPGTSNHGNNPSKSSVSIGPEPKRNVNQGLRSRSHTTPKGVSERSSVVVLKRSQHKHLSHMSSSPAPSMGGANSALVAVPPASPAQLITASGSDDCFRNVQDVLTSIQVQQEQVLRGIETLPSSGNISSPLDKDMLLLKATSGATVACLEQCLSILQQQQIAGPSNPAITYGANTDNFPTKPLQLSLPVPTNRLLSDPVSPAESYVSASSLVNEESATTGECPRDDADCPPGGPGEDEDPQEELLEDEEDVTEDLGNVEEHKSVILHLLSQLKLGMDLTKVVLPTFILERRSLLELFADCMAHPDMFNGITDLPTPEARMLAVAEWYIMSFHAGKKGSVAKKPYNPIIGETFHCSWEVPPTFQSSPTQMCTRCGQSTKLTNGVADSDHVIEKQQTNGQMVNGAMGEGSLGTQGESSNGNVEVTDGTRLSYCAEQVSHHPPVSAFYFECPEKKMYMNASIWTKSKFMGMSIGVVMVGKVYLRLLEHNEEYEFSLPSAYARSILTIPWVELGDKVQISCPNTGYNASVTFHTKPFYGGKLHKVSSEVRNPAGDVVCRGNGEWNDIVEFTYNNGSGKIIETKRMKTLRKCVRSIKQQGDFESRKLWKHVTEALAKGDIDTATQHKRFLEERQRQGERHRKETNTAFPTKYFHKEGDRWVYNNLLKAQPTTAS